jgi:hypothetical protein
VLAAIAHATAQQAVHQALGQQAHHTRVAVEGAAADHAAGAEVQVQHRREAQVHAAGAQLGGQHMAGGRGGIGGGERVLHPLFTQHPHRRQVGETVGAEALHAATFVVHADQQVGPQLLGRRGEFGQLAAAFEIAREQDQPASERVAQAPGIGLGQRGAGDVEHHGGVQGHGVGSRWGAWVSTTTKDEA